MVVMGHPSAQNPKQVIQGLQLWRVGREEDQPQPWAMSSQQRGDLSRLFGTVAPGIVDRDDGLPPSGPRSTDERIAQGAERETIPAVSVQADRRAAAPIHGGKEVPFATGSGLGSSAAAPGASSSGSGWAAEPALFRPRRTDLPEAAGSF
jgi:hypothetical protein